MRKKRILMINEFSDLCTGFSTYGKEVLSRLYATGKYEIAELASYVGPEDSKLDKFPWKIYPVIPSRDDKRGMDHFNRTLPLSQFGEQALTPTLLDFKPDFIFSIRDPWFDEFILRNPLRKHYKYFWMVTCDGEPQKDEWLDWYRRTDGILTYSNWAKNLLENHKIKVLGVPTPGADTNIFMPTPDMAAHRQKMNIPEDWFIVQTVMRNQPRKLYPELFKSFALYLKMCKKHGKTDLAAKSFLHIHTSMNDAGWDISKEIQRYNLDHKVLITYKCQATGKYYISFYKGEPAFSRFSGQQTSVSANTGNGLTREELADVHKIANLYIQYSVCEGLGMPQLDAKSCGVPTMGIPYSATAEMNLEENGGIPLKIAAYYQEQKIETAQRRVVPDNQYTANAIYSFAVSGDKKKEKLAKNARKFAETHTWERATAIWEKIFDKTPISDTWANQPNIWTPEKEIPFHLSNEQFVEWVYKNILGRPELLNLYVKMSIVEQLNRGVRNNQAFNKNIFVQEMMEGCQSLNNLEQHLYLLSNNKLNTVMKPRCVVV